jgi:hypothetical protein
VDLAILTSGGDRQDVGTNNVKEIQEVEAEVCYFFNETKFFGLKFQCFFFV